MACVVLAAIVAVLGTALQALPIDALRIIIGALLLLFGLQWLRKAVLRAAGLKALHDEDERVRARDRRPPSRRRASRTASTGIPSRSSFKGVLLEGLEVALIVVTLGSDARRHGARRRRRSRRGAVRRRRGCRRAAPLAKVPENTLKFAVGVMLTTYGLFWAGEGLGVSWPGGDAMLLVIALAVLAASLITVRSLRQRTPRSAS